MLPLLNALFSIEDDICELVLIKVKLQKVKLKEKI